MSRREFELTEQQHAKLLDACKPVPAMYLSGGQPMFRSQQENANDAWAALGSEIGFDGASVQPVTGKTSRFFTAEIVEPPVKSPALAAIAKSEACGKRGPRTGALCRRFKGHEQPPSPLLGADFHEAGDSEGVIERWPVTAEEIPTEKRFLHHAAPGARYAEPMDPVEREIAAADLFAKPLGKFKDRLVDEAGEEIQEADPGPEPPLADKEAELDQVRELLKAAGFVPVDNFSRQGAPGSGVHYLELRGPFEPVILRTQFLFNKPASWCLMAPANQSSSAVRGVRDLESLRSLIGGYGDWDDDPVGAALLTGKARP